MLIYFDGVPHTEYGLALLKGTNYELLPALTEQLQTVTGKVGAYLSRSSYKERRFSFPFTLDQAADDALLNQQMDDLKAAFLNEWGEVKDVTMQFSHQMDRYYRIRLTNTTTYSREFAMADITLHFIAPDPYQYAVEPITFDLPMGGTALTSLSTVADPVLRWTCYSNSVLIFTLTVRTSDQAFHTIELEKTNGDRWINEDVIEIDFKANRVKVNGVDAMEMIRWQASDFFPFPRGTVEFTYPDFFEGKGTYIPKWL